MFRISRRTDYSVRVMLVLAQSPGGRVPTARVQADTLVPLAFLQRLVATLRRGGLLHAYAGQNGGLQLARPADQVTLLDVHEAVEGPVALSECLARPCTCPLSGPCPVRPRWGRLEAAILRELRATTLADLAREHAPRAVGRASLAVLAGTAPTRTADPSRKPSRRDARRPR